MVDVNTVAYPDNMHEMYVTQRLGVKDIANKIGQPYADVMRFIRSKGWIQELQEQEVEVVHKAAQGFREHVAEKRLPTAVDHLSTSDLMLHEIREKLKALRAGKDFCSARDLSNLCKALKDASDVGARSVGLSEKMFEGMGADTTPPPPKPLILVGVKPKELEPSTPPPIDITAQVAVIEAEEEDPF